jgi:hypothetical protein
LRLFFGAIATGVPFAIGAADILNHFYRQGGYVLDSGLLAYLMTHADPGLALPRALGSGSFYAAHVTPVFWLLAQLAKFLPLTPPQFFAAFIGLGQALLAGGVYWALVGPIGLRGWRGLTVAALLAIAFADSGLGIAILRYPHFEILIAAAAILFLVALHERRYGLAAIFFALALATREDAGFHVAIFLATILAVGSGRGARDARPMLAFLLTGTIYSAIAMAAQHWAFPDQSAFLRIYAGEPAFGHVTPQLVATRLVGWTLYRSYAILPAAVAIAWAVLRRNPLIAAGYLATLPWLAVHLVAISDLASTLSSYYAFPLLIASFWPLLGVLGGKRAADGVTRREAVIGFALMIAASFTALSVQHNPNHVSFAATFAPPPSLATMRSVAQAVTALSENQAELGNILVDSGVASLAPDGFSRAQVIWDEAPPGIDTIIFFADGFDAAPALRRAESAGLARRYVIAGTPIRIATDRVPEQMPGLAGLLQETPPP